LLPIIYCLSQDTRLHDNPALFYAMKTHKPVIFLYVDETDSQSQFLKGAAQKIRMRQALLSFENKLKQQFNAHIIFRSGNRIDIIEHIIKQTGADAVFWNRRYLPYQIELDTHLKARLKEIHIDAQSFKANLLFDPHDIKNQLGDFYKVYTPFKKACIIKGFDSPPLPVITQLNVYKNTLETLLIDELYPLPKKTDWATKLCNQWNFSEEGAFKLLNNFLENGLKNYKEGRNFPFLSEHTSRLSIYLAQGLISPRQIIYALQDVKADQDSDHFKSELLWREFSYHLIFHASYMIYSNFRPEWDNFPWCWTENDQNNFKRWCHGQTGVPIIDAAMQELWQTGYMHNRCRMIVASYLVKHLLIDWKHGEAWFKDTLLDYDTANNIAGWQWVSGSGADAAPYFRVFNPMLQSKKFDKDALYIKKYCPILKNINANILHNADDNHSDLAQRYHYYMPLISLEKGRKRALEVYKIFKNQ
jgi:deoxyribodipyrimidine photo-lyase